MRNFNYFSINVHDDLGKLWTIQLYIKKAISNGQVKPVDEIAQLVVSSMFLSLYKYRTEQFPKIRKKIKTM